MKILWLLYLSMVGIGILSCVVATFDETNIHSQSQVKDYCQFESFQPQCWKNEIIIMESALYGRRATGRCIEMDEDVQANDRDPRYLGCYVDVLELADLKCSGKPQCEIKIPDSDFASTKPCYKGLAMYFEASYSCVTVVDEDRSCTVSVSSSPLHITSSSLSKIGCGTKSQPWTLEAPAGQRINMTLLDFSSNGKSVQGQESSTQHMAYNCNVQYGYIIDKAARKNVSICANKTSRKSEIYLSSINSVELVQSNNINYNYIIRVEEDTWLKRNDDEAIIGCYSSRQTWHLQCRDQKWVGVVSNCTQAIEIAQYAPDVTASHRDYQVLIIVAIGFIGLAVCLIIIFSGIVCLRRFHAQEEKIACKAEKSDLKYTNFTTNPVQQFDTPIIHPKNGLCPLVTSSTLFQNQDEYLLAPQQNTVARRSDDNTSNGNLNHQAAMTANSQYFVLDQELVARENETNRLC